MNWKLNLRNFGINDFLAPHLVFDFDHFGVILFNILKGIQFGYWVCREAQNAWSFFWIASFQCAPRYQNNPFRIAICPLCELFNKAFDGFILKIICHLVKFGNGIFTISWMNILAFPFELIRIVHVFLTGSFRSFNTGIEVDGLSRISSTHSAEDDA